MSTNLDLPAQGSMAKEAMARLGWRYFLYFQQILIHTMTMPVIFSDTFIALRQGYCYTTEWPGTEKSASVTTVSFLLASSSEIEREVVFAVAYS